MALNDGSSYHKRAATFMLQKDYGHAVEDFTTALRLDPSADKKDIVFRYMFRGVAYREMEKFDLALSDLDEAIRREPANGLAYAHRGRTWMQKENYDRALPDLDKSIKLSDKDSNVFSARGFVHLKRGEIDSALSDCESSLRLDGANRLALRVRGDIWLGKNEFDRAIADYNNFLGPNPSDSKALVNRALAWFQKGNYERAVTDLDEAIKLDPGNARALAVRGNALESRGRPGDLNRASEDLHQSLAIKPEQPEIIQLKEVVDNELAEERAGSKPPGRRIALVVGNSKYTDAPHLANPEHDANAIAASLRRLGFSEVIELYDLDKQHLVDELKTFGDKAAQLDWAVVFFAGHGVQVDGQSYLIPIDAKLLRASHVVDEAVPIDRVLAKVADARQMRLVILDACRNNPFLARMVQPEVKRSLARGLAPIEKTGGVLVVYSARDGQVAEDGAGEHSPFTQALLENLEQPGVEIELLFRRVRDTVLNRTTGGQEPFTYGSISGSELYFKMQRADKK